MTCFEWVIILVVFGIVTMIETVVISTTIGKIVENKMTAKVKLELDIFEKEMKAFGDFLEKYIGQIMTGLKDIQNLEKTIKRLQDENWKLKTQIEDMKN